MERATLLCKVLFISLCCGLFMIDGRQPPAHAQSAQDEHVGSEVYGIAMSNAVQTKRVDDIVDRLEKMDTRLSKQGDATNANTNAIAGIDGETKGIGAVLIMLQIGGMVFQMKGQRRKQDP